MTDRFEHRLSEYLDGTLEPHERGLIERHLAECPRCARTLVDLERVTEFAGRVPPRAPAADLWPAIAARMTAPQDVVEESRPTPIRRRIALSIPQLAAATVIIASLSGGIAWLTASRAAETPRGPVATRIRTPEPGPASAVQAGAEAEEPLETAAYYAASIEELQRILFDPSRELPPQTAIRVRRALTTIDRAIEDGRQALERSPDDPYLSGHILRTLRRKSEFLRGALQLSAQS